MQIAINLITVFFNWTSAHFHIHLSDIHQTQIKREAYYLSKYSICVQRKEE